MPVIIGTPESDTLTGTNASDEIYAMNGDNSVNAGAGDDVIYSGSARDFLHGEAGNDRIFGGWADDYLYGGDGNDALFGGRGEGFDRLYGGDGDDALHGGLGYDWIRGGEGADMIYGGGGRTAAISFDWDLAGVTVDLRDGFAIDAHSDRDTLVGVNEAYGTNRADILRGDNDGQYEWFVGYAGDDTINGRGGTDDWVAHDRDTGRGIDMDLATGVSVDEYGDTDRLVRIENVRGTNSDDIIRGNSEVNWLRGLGGSDTLNGRGGEDWADYRSDPNFGGTQGIIANLATNTIIDGYGDTDRVISIENVFGTSMGDQITGDGVDNALSGLFGDDTLIGRGGDDAFLGGQGDDRIDGGLGTDLVTYDYDEFYGGAAGVRVDLAAGTATDTFGDTDTLISIENAEGSDRRDFLFGDGRANELYGADGDDALYGRVGQDRLDGGRDDDFLVGGIGVDVFAFRDDAGDDRILDFDASGETLDFTEHSGVNDMSDVTIAADGGNTIVSFHDGSVVLVGVAVGAIDASDFVFA